MTRNSGRSTNLFAVDPDTRLDVLTSTLTMSDEEFVDAAKQLTERLVTMPDTTPVPFRHQNGGDYDEHLVLRPEHASGETGIGIHYGR